MMNLIVALEQRFEGTPDGRVWTPFANSFWQRYLNVFEHMWVVARGRRVAAPTPGWSRADGAGVSFAPVTYYLGPWQYLRCRRRILADVRGVVGPSDAVILRVCSQGRRLPGAAATPRGAALRRGGCRRSVRRLCARGGRASAASVLPQGLRTTFSWVFWGFHGKHNIRI